MRGPLLGLLAAMVLTGQTAAQATLTRSAITYISGGAAYLQVGRDDGLAVGMVVAVVRNGVRVAELTVRDLASHRASCTIPPAAAALVAVGDTVEFVASLPVARATASQASRGGGPAQGGGMRVRGRLGVRYLVLRPELGGGGFSQPALDLRLDLSQAGGSGASIDVRARQSYVTRSDGTTSRDSRTAVYQAALQVRSPNHPWRASLGRQYLAPVSSLSLFDGLLVEAQGSRLGAGVFAGSEPDQGTMGYSSAIRDYGAFVELRQAPGGRSRWSAATGAVGSYQAGEVNREFLFTQLSVTTPGFTLFAMQELDVNRSWKLEAGEPSLALTSSFVSLTARPSQAVSLLAGVDTRRRVRLYRDRATPELVFDDSFRQGVWSGVSIRAGAHLRLGIDGRAALGGADSTARSRSATGSFSLERLTAQQIAVRSRYTRYSTARGAGWLGTLSVGARPSPGVGVEFNAGRRTENASLDPFHRQTSWIGGDVDLAVGRAVYLLLSGARERGDNAAGDQLLVSVSVRF